MSQAECDVADREAKKADLQLAAIYINETRSDPSPKPYPSKRMIDHASDSK